jgi:hypothetical protein
MNADSPLGRCHFGTAAVPCGAHVYWLRHETTGRMAPVDVEPDPAGKGNIRIDPQAGTYAVVAGEALLLARYGGEALRLNHWVTCPAAQAKKHARNDRA